MTLGGTWSPSATGVQTIAASGWTFHTIAFGLTIPVTCTFTSAPPSVTRTVIPPATLSVGPDALRAGRPVRVSGADWARSSTGTVSLCTDAAGTANCTAIGTVTTNASGRLCGSGLIPAGTPAGKYSIAVTVDPDTKAAGISVLADRGPGDGRPPDRTRPRG